MKHILVLLLVICFVPHTFGNFTEGYVEELQKEKQTYSWQPFVVGGVAIGQPTSFRLQAGLVKRWGFYIAGTTNFRFEFQPDSNKGNYGEEYIDVSGVFTGKKRYSRKILQAGPVFHINPNLMMYFGMGVGKCFILQETVNGDWLWSDHYVGFFNDWTLLESDLGFMYRIKRFVISAGSSYGTSFYKTYFTANVGFGITF